MATRTRPRGADVTPLEDAAERLLEPALAVAGVALAVAVALPLVPVALPVLCGLLWARRARGRLAWLLTPLCAAPACAAVLAALVASHSDPVDLAARYADAQLDAAGAILAGWPAVDWRAVGLAYAGGLWVYAVTLGPLLGAAIASIRFVSTAVQGSEDKEQRSELKVRDAAKLADEPIRWIAANVVGRQVIGLLSAPPGGGKGWWTWALARAAQDGTTFFGLEVAGVRVLWCTEEGASFARTRARFGVGTGVVYALHRHEVQGWDWPDLVREVRRRAWRHGCGLVIFDTVRAWCPRAERSPEDANAVMHVVRQELAAPGLAVLFAHHDRKGGGAFGEGVSGTYGLVGAVDVLIELRRVGDDPADPRRRMVTSRRVDEPLDLTARLEGHRYVLLPGQGQKEARLAARAAVRGAVQRGQLAPASARVCATPGCGRPAVAWHHPGYALGQELAVAALCRDCHQRETADPAATLRETVRAVRDAGGALTTAAFMAALGIKGAAASKRLKAAEAAGLLRPEGPGGRRGPRVWRTTD
jgi:hypothetical protein